MSKPCSPWQPGNVAVLAAVAALAVAGGPRGSAARKSRGPSRSRRKRAAARQPKADPDFMDFLRRREATEGIWHQTSREAVAAIRRQGFSLAHPRAITGDDQMPNGVFLKFFPNYIGVVGPQRDPVQLRVRANVSNPLVVNQRDDLVQWLRRNRDYDAYARKVDGAMQRHDKAIEKLQRQADAMIRDFQSGRISLEEAEEKRHLLIARDDALNASLTQRLQDMSGEGRRIVTEIMKSKGYDSLFMTGDVGSGGRVVTTLVVLDPENVVPLDYRASVIPEGWR